MRVAFLTYGTYPVPATKGGAVENLIEDLLDENEKNSRLDFTVFSIWEEKAFLKAQKYTKTTFNFIKCPKIIDGIDKLIYKIAKWLLKKGNLISYRFILRRLYVMFHYPKYLIKQDFDKVVLVTNSTLFFVLKNIRVSRKYKDRVVYYLHNEVRTLFRCQKEAASIHSLIGISEFVNRSFRKQVPSLCDSQCYVLKNCVDMNAFSGVNEKKIQEYRSKFGIKKDDFIVIFAGRIVREKGALETLEAVKMCNRENIKLLIVGGGFYSSDVVDNYSLELQKCAEIIRERIIFTGYIDYEQMPYIYALGNVAVLPSIWDEPAGMTMVEAVASGLPLITTNSGGIPEYIPEGAAILLERDDSLISNIAKSIELLMDNEELANSMIKEGKKLNNELNLNNYYSNFCDLIQR